MSNENWVTSEYEQKKLSEEVESLNVKEDDISQKKELDQNDDDDGKSMAKGEPPLLKQVLHNKLVQYNQELQVQLQSPNSLLYPVKSLDELHLKKELLDGMHSMGFNQPSKLQKTALPLFLANPPLNLIVESYFGTGKTAAFILTMLSRCDTSKTYPQCLCLSPTYEIALQTGKQVELMGRFIKNLQVGYAVRGNRGIYVYLLVLFEWYK